MDSTIVLCACGQKNRLPSLWSPGFGKAVRCGRCQAPLAKPAPPPAQTTPCDECGNDIPNDEPSMFSDSHDESCSLYPDDDEDTDDDEEEDE